MGEYARYAGKLIKIGTCENMHYLRADQATMVEPVEHSLDPVARAADIRFRFPFPDEDRIEPGEFEDHTRGVAVTAEVPILADSHHRGVVFTSETGFAVKLACPLSRAGLEDGGYRRADRGDGHNVATVRILQQAVRHGALTLVCACAACGARFHLPTLADARPVILACRAAAGLASTNGLTSRAIWWTEVADRIAIGYTHPPEDLIRAAQR